MMPKDHSVSVSVPTKPGRLDFVCEDEERTLECTVEYEDGLWLLKVDDQDVAVF